MSDPSAGEGLLADPARAAAVGAARERIEPGMTIGLGSGRAVFALVDLLAATRPAPLRLRAVVASSRTEARTREAGIELVTLDDDLALDLAVDGADEVDPGLALLKGGGGALLREKIVAAASRRMIVIADGSKRVDTLGRFPLPIEVVPFGLGATLRAVEAAAAALGARGAFELRRSRPGEPLVTDGGHYIVDAHLGRIERPEALAAALAAIPGVVEHGLFLGLATGAVLATEKGLVELGEVRP
jgi:ribose 5-phosphate isomerase A